MNPRVPTDYAEAGRWLRNFVASHAKREDARIEALVTEGDREDSSYEVRLVISTGSGAGVSLSLAELDYREVAEGRTRLAWCEDQARRIHEAARDLVTQARGRESRSA
jgi:hypothetical protein